MDQTSLETMGAARRMAMVEEIVAAVRAEAAPTVPKLREIRRKATTKLKSASGEDVRLIGATLARVGQWWMSYEVIAAHREAMGGIALKEIEALGQGMSTWEQVDTFGVLIAGEAWRAGAIADRDVQRWAKSKDLWWRRAALVATTVLNGKTRGGRGDTRRTLAICEMLVADKEDMVVKAMSWALRSLIQWDADAVEVFLLKHDGRLAARAKREVRNKLKTGLKTPKRKKA
jgi:3-methyladenine DNA glycosylase AlkD